MMLRWRRSERLNHSGIFRLFTFHHQERDGRRMRVLLIRSFFLNNPYLSSHLFYFIFFSLEYDEPFFIFSFSSASFIIIQTVIVIVYIQNIIIITWGEHSSWFVFFSLSWPPNRTILELLGVKCPADDKYNPFYPYPRYLYNEKAIVVCVDEQPRLIHCPEGQVVDQSSYTCVSLEKDEHHPN